VAKDVQIKANDALAIVATCPAGSKIIGGGGGSDVFAATNFAMAWSIPVTGQASGEEGWSVGIVNRSNATQKGLIAAYAICATVK
jgi:hypothetical protein